MELQAAHAREASLREQLERRDEAYDQNVGSEKELAHRATTLDEREAKLAEFEVELEERERRVRDQREAIEAEHARVADLQAELAAEQSLTVEQQEARGEAAAGAAVERPGAREGGRRAPAGAGRARRP